MRNRRLDEIELVAIIGKPARNVSKEDALNYVAGYCIGLDMTVRGAEERSMRKSIDTFTVMGPWMVTPDEIADPHNLDLNLTVNGQPRQNNNTKNLIIKIHELIEWASIYYTLHPGDLFMTGTPDGVVDCQPGDVVVTSIEGIGDLVNRQANQAERVGRPEPGGRLQIPRVQQPGVCGSLQALRAATNPDDSQFRH